jgi:hypothetical protein
MEEKPVEGITDKDTIDRQMAAHEAGHAVVGLAIGRRLRKIERIQGRPADSHLSESIRETFITTFHPEKDGVEERLQLLNTAAGMAGESYFSKKHYAEIGQDDLARLCDAGLSETQIDKLIHLGGDTLHANHTFFEDIWNEILNAINRNQSDLINGALVNSHFMARGKKFTDFAKLEKIFTTGPKAT